MFLQDEDVVCKDIPHHVPGMEHIFTVSNASHTKLFLPASILSLTSDMTKPLSATSSYSSTSEIINIAQQKKILEWYEQLADRKKRIQKSQEELALDDWSGIDEVQQKQLNEADESMKETKVSTNVALGHSNTDVVVNGDDNEVFELHNHVSNTDESPKNSTLEFHSEQSCQNELQHSSSQTPSCCGDSLSEPQWNCQGFDGKYLYPL